jgi:hypothetical protein
MNRLFPLISGLLLAAGLSCAPNAGAATFIVNNNQDVPDEFPGNGICKPIGAVGDVCTLRAAIMEANALGGTHTILLPSGNYNLTRAGIGEDLAVNGDLDVTAQITIANFTDNPPVIYAINQDRVFDIRTGGSLQLINAVVGGGLANAPGNVHGGAFRVAAGASLGLNRVLVTTNVGNIGGAIYSDGNVGIIDSEFMHNGIIDHNVAAGFADGAAIFNRGALTIERSTLHSNGVVPGGEGLVPDPYAIRARRTGTHPDPFTRLINVTLAGNTRGIYSGTVMEQTHGMPLDLRMSTIVNNGDRGIRFIPHFDQLDTPQLTIGLTVVFGHTFADCNTIFSDQAWSPVGDKGNASGDGSCGFDGATDQQHIAWPFFGVLDYHGGLTPVLLPHPNGALVDKGALVCAPTNEDQRGKPRPINATGTLLPICDIGAVEYDPQTDPQVPSGIFHDGFEE